MGLKREGYSDAIQGRTRVAVDIDAAGNIATPGTEVAGTFNFTITQANPENSLAQNTQLLEFFMSLVNGAQNSNTNIATVTWEV